MEQDGGRKQSQLLNPSREADDWLENNCWMQMIFFLLLGNSCCLGRTEESPLQLSYPLSDSETIAMPY
jgi:hypothetical protein